MKKYLKLFRCSHYLKNMLIFLPLFFSDNLFNVKNLIWLGYMIIPFCLVSSVIYIINDIKDVEKDKMHPQKSKRPIASGTISIYMAKKAVYILVSLMILTLGVVSWIDYLLPQVPFLLFIYFIINFGYSSGLKNVPILDVFILAAGYLIRVFYGAVVIEVEVSPWLYLTVLTGALYLGMGKRRNEIRNVNGVCTRKVLQKYNYEFLDKNMHICEGLAISFYALWAIQTDYYGMVWTVPYIIFIFMKYSLDIENEESGGDPMRVILGDSLLVLLTLVYALTVFLIIYIL